MNIIPENEATAQEQTTPIEAAEIADSAPAPEMVAEETTVLGHEEEAALHEIGNDGLEPSTPFDIPVPGNEIVSEEQEPQETVEVSDSPTAEEVETPVHEGEAALQDIGHDGLEPPFDIPTPGDVVVPFEKSTRLFRGNNRRQGKRKKTVRHSPAKQSRKLRTPGRNGKNRLMKLSRKTSPNPVRTRLPKKRRKSPTALQSREKHRNPINPPNRNRGQISAAIRFPQKLPNRHSKKHRPRNSPPNRRKHPAPANRSRLFI